MKKLILTAALTLSLTGYATADTTGTATAAFSDAQKAQIGEIAAGYLRAHPEILIEMSQKLQAQAQNKQMASAAGAALANQDALLNDPSSPVLHPITGNIVNESSGLNSSVLLSERMDFKLHREGLILDTVPYNTAVCYEYPSVILPKSRYRYQMVNTIPDVASCHPLGRNVMLWQTGKEMPNSKKNYGYLIWKKRNCVVL